VASDVKPETIMVWEVSPGYNGADYAIIGDRAAAGAFVAEQAEMLWDGGALAATTPGPVVRVRCYEMPKADFEELVEED
jgi:hypothetical protein